MLRTILTTTVLTTIVLFTVSAQAETTSANKDAWYLSGGIGMSSVEPDMGVSGYKLDDDQDTAFKLSVGKEISSRFSAEVFYADLGAAALDDQGNAALISNGSVEYSLMGVSGIMYPLVNTAKGKSQLEPYFQVGLATLDTGGNVDVKSKNSTQLHFGAGVEYNMGDKAVRVFYDTYDTDAGLMGIALVKRLGVAQPKKKRAKAPAVATVKADKKPWFRRTKQAAPVTQVAAAPAQAVTVEKLEDVLNDSNLRSIGFAVGSANLTPFSKGVLDTAALFLIEQQAMNITIIAHTDNSGDEGKNLRLSKARAATVLRYLVRKGVAEERLVAKGYGEYDPVASNDTKEGRETNRRVEFLIAQ